MLKGSSTSQQRGEFFYQRRNVMCWRNRLAPAARAPLPLLKISPLNSRYLLMRGSLLHLHHPLSHSSPRSLSCAAHTSLRRSTFPTFYSSLPLSPPTHLLPSLLPRALYLPVQFQGFQAAVTSPPLPKNARAQTRLGLFINLQHSPVSFIMRSQ